MSHKVISAIAFILALTLSSCASIQLYNPQPDKMYEGDRPLSDTAVFSARDELSSICPLARTIHSVDNRSTSKWAYPMWVRVTPGTHSFSIQCTIKTSLGFHEVGRYYVNLDVTIPEMKPRHVYVANYEEVAGKIKITAEDLGENSYYSIQIGEKFVTPEF